MNNQIMNNVQVSGIITKVREKEEQIKLTIVNINQNVPIIVIINKTQWENFQKDFPTNSVTIYGELHKIYNTYFVKARNISCFHNILKEENINESKTEFYGNVRLKEKIEYDTHSNICVKRFVFQTLNVNSTTFRAFAIRKFANYFENIEVGSNIFIRADYVSDKNGSCWRIHHQPKILPTKRNL